MDFLNFMIAVNERTGNDYGDLATLNGCLADLARAGTTDRGSA